MDSAKNPIIPDLILIKKILITHSSIDCNPESIDGNNVHGYEMNIGHEIAYNLEKSMCRVRLRLEFVGVKEDHVQLEIFGKFTLETHFHIENIKDCISRTNEGVLINKDLPATLLSLAYSTARGIVLERTTNTPFKGIVIPVIDPYKILESKDFTMISKRN